jgi:phosphohistidine phosphatase
MKQLILVRHAAAAPEQFPGKDFDRVLAESGLLEARQLGSFLLEKGVFPQHVVCSSAVRTNQTASLVRDIIGKTEIPFTSSPLLYNAGFPVLMQFLQKFSDEFQSMMLVAHNPGISQLATVLSGQHPYQFSTASGLCLQFDVQEWKNIQTGSGKEIWFFNP